MRPYYPFKSKLFNSTTYSFECPNINDTLSVKACLCKRRQFSSNSAASIQKIHTVQRTSSPWWVVFSDTCVYIRWFSPTFLTRNQAKILILKGLNRRRSTPWDWGIILILFWFGVWFCWLDGIIITPSCVLKMFNRGMSTLVQWTIHDVLHAIVSWLWRGSSLVKMHWRWNLAHSGHRVTFLMGCIQWYDYNHPFISVVLWHLMTHIIKYKDMVMVKVEKISPQQAQSQL